MKLIAYMVGGLIAGSALSWVALLSWAALTLDARDSLFDRSPESMQFFLVAWLITAIGGCASGWLLARRSRPS
jgi:hypothetical protein